MKVKTLNGQTRFWKPKPINWDEACTVSIFQNECKKILAMYWVGDVVAEEQLLPGTKQRFDFVNFTKRIIVESHGEQHFKMNKFFHNNNIFNFVNGLKRDEKKRKFAELNGFKMIEVTSPTELHQIMINL